MNRDAIGVAIDDLRTFQRIFLQIEIGCPARFRTQLFIRSLQCVCIFFQADDVVAHDAEDRRMQTRMSESFDLVDIIGGGQFARAGMGEVGQGIDMLEIGRCQRLIQRPAPGIARQRGMRLVTDAGLDMNFIHAVGDARRIDIPGQTPVLCVEVYDLRHCLRRKRHEGVGTFQIVILQRWFVDLRNQCVFIGAVGLHRVEVLGTFVERGIQHIGARIGCRIGIVPRPRSAGTQQCGQHHQQQHATGH